MKILMRSGTLSRMPPDPSADLPRLAAAVLDARHRLGLTQQELKTAGHISATSLIDVERARHIPGASTLRGLDRGLGWPIGTAEAIMAGGPIPEPTEKPRLDRADNPDITATLARIEAKTDALIALVTGLRHAPH